MKKIIFLVLIFFICFFISCTNSKQKIKTNIMKIKEVEKQADQVSNDLKIVIIDSAFTKAIITAERGQIFTSENYSLLDGGVKIIFFSKKNKSDVVIKADEVRIDDISKNMFAKGNVVVISDSTNTSLETQKLNWDNIEKKIYSDLFVKITTPKEIINGVGFESDEHLHNYKIFKVTGVMSNE